MLRATVPGIYKKGERPLPRMVRPLGTAGEEQAMTSTDLDLCYLTATEAIDQFKAKKLSPMVPTAAVRSAYLRQSMESLATSRRSGATRSTGSIRGKRSCIMAR